MRSYIATTWNNADTNDYSGRQQHFKSNGAANILAYAEEAPKKAKKAKKPDFRLTSEKTIDRLEKHRADLEAAFESGELSFERYDVLLREWEDKMNRAWRCHEKATGKSFDEETNGPSLATKPSFTNTIEDCARGFAARHPFMFTVGSIIFGCGLLNIVGFGG